MPEWARGRMNAFPDAAQVAGGGGPNALTILAGVILVAQIFV